MARVLVFCYLIALLVRPQDWFGPFIGLPTGFVITLAMFVGGLVNYLSDRSRYETPHNRLLPIYILVIFASTLINTDFGNAMDQAVTFGKRAVLFFSIVWLVNTRERAYFTVWSFVLILLFLSFQAVLQAFQFWSYRHVLVFLDTCQISTGRYVTDSSHNLQLGGTFVDGSDA